ncbi:MAG TPA: cyanophycin synthetase [bacterium]
MHFPDFSSVEHYLDSLVNYEQAFPLGGARDRPKLAPTLAAIERLKLPLRLPQCIHIAGTKGKGSTVSFLECLLSEGHRVLSFTSPHLMSVKERVRLNGKLLDDAVWQKGFAEIHDRLGEEPAIKLTYFESVLIFYLWAARELKSDVHVVEAGLGGKWDATNVLENTLAVLTLVDYDHTEILGNTLTEIATDKSGIIKHAVRVVVGRQPEEALQVYRRRIVEEQAKAHYFGADYGWEAVEDEQFRYWDNHEIIGTLRLSMPGVHQRDNAAIALRAARLLVPDLDPQVARVQLRQCKIPGRQQLLAGSPDVMVDVAHNPVSFAALAATLRERYAGRRILAVVGMMKDKDAKTSLACLKGLVDELLVVALPNPRSAKLETLREIANSLGFNVRCPESLDRAFEELHGKGGHDLGLVAGSFYLAGDYLRWRQRAGIA